MKGKNVRTIRELREEMARKRSDFGIHVIMNNKDKPKIRRNFQAPVYFFGEKERNGSFKELSMRVKNIVKGAIDYTLETKEPRPIAILKGKELKRPAKKEDFERPFLFIVKPGYEGGLGPVADGSRGKLKRSTSSSLRVYDISPGKIRQLKTEYEKSKKKFIKFNISEEEFIKNKLVSDISKRIIKFMLGG
ncbi:hypothetical protein KJ660_02660 [Candidatus Micrarchaeota archaeon]|nr:hypothetical protein [Candidatus Micrarchaeota archaeon]